MNYTKIRLDFKYAEKNRFFRVVLINGNPKLDKLGLLFVHALGGEMVHEFLYHANNTRYVPQAWLEEWDEGEALEGKSLSDLSSNFEFYYDTGDGWDFKCMKYAKEVILNDDKPIIVLDGAGMGIWEDNIQTLYAYLSGEIDPKFSKEDEERGIHKPWNHKINRYSDFDKPLNITKLNEDLECILGGYDEYDELQGENNLDNAIVEVVESQYNILPYVKDKVDQLALKYGKEEAIKMVASVLDVIIREVVTTNKPFDEKRYKELLNELN